MLLLLHAMFCREAGRTFLSSSACRHAVRTISSPAFAGDWRVVSEDSELFPTRSFLRIVRTLITLPGGCLVAGFSDFPAFGQFLLRLRDR